MKALKTNQKRHKGTAHAQSAMEYLMTYGWAILIIAVVLGAMFQLGIFGAANILGTACVASPGYLCENPTLTTSGDLTFSLGQSTSSTVYNIQLACAASQTSKGFPNPTTSFNTIMADGTTEKPLKTGIALASGQVIVVSELPCYDTNGNELNSPNIGSGFSGYLWLNWTTDSGTESATNPWSTTKLATIRVEVS